MPEPTDTGICSIDQKNDNKKGKKKKQKRNQETDPVVFVSDGAGIKSLHPVKLCFVGSDQLTIVLLGSLIQRRGGICWRGGCGAIALAWIIIPADGSHDPAIGVRIGVLYISGDIPMHRGLGHVRFLGDILIGFSGLFF